MQMKANAFRKAWVILGSLALLAVLALQLFLRMPRWLLINEPPFKSDVIVVLSGHNNKGRILHGISLYKKGIAPRIFFSGASSDLERETGVYLQKVYAMAHGVPESAIEIENLSASTYENAVYLQKYLDQQGYKSFVLVTSPVHSFRSKIFFKRVISPDVRWALSCDPSQIDLDHWWRKVATAREVFYEYLALPYCLLRKQ